MADTIVVPDPDVPSRSSTNHSSTVQESFESSGISRGKPPTTQKNESPYLSTIRKQLKDLGFTSRSSDVIVASWRKGTTAQYQTYLQKWLEFCKQKHCDVLSPSLPMALDFLSMLYEKGSSYSAINTARSMLSSILQLDINSSTPFGQLPIVRRFMKGIFELRPALPRYKSIWDLSVVFNYFRGRPSAPELSLKDLTLKLTFLLSLLSGQRCQTIKYLTTENMELTTDQCVFKIMDKVKQTRVGTHIQPVVFKAYPKDEKLCTIAHLKEYIKRTTPFRNASKQLLLSHVKPHGPVSKDTISRWCRTVLSTAGVDTSKFKGHSTIAASSSFLADNNINIKDIMLSAGWSSERTFQQFYHKSSEPEFNYGHEILRTFAQN